MTTDFSPREFALLPTPYTQQKALHLIGQARSSQNVETGAREDKRRAFDLVLDRETTKRKQQLRIMETHNPEEGMLEVLRLDEANLEQAQREFSACKVRHEKADAALKQWEIVPKLKDWLTTTASDPNAKLKECRHRGKLLGTSPKEAVELYRAKLDENAQAYRHASNAEAKSHELVSILQNQIALIAERGSKKIDRRDRNDPLGINPGYNSLAGAYGTFLTQKAGEPNEAAAFLIWLFHDDIKRRLDELVGEDGPGALAYDQREQLIEKLAAERLAIERAEEAAIVAAEAEGTFIPRRPDADPRAVLEIEEA